MLSQFFFSSNASSLRLFRRAADEDEVDSELSSIDLASYESFVLQLKGKLQGLIENKVRDDSSEVSCS
jgi:hypothetical protein